MISDIPILKRATTINLDVIMLKVFDNEKVQDFIEDLNKEQLQQSIDSKGERLSYVDAKGRTRTGYSPLTAKLSGGKKKIGQPFNLFDTGEFYKSIKLSPELNGVEITANPIKEDDNLFKKFGEDIIGLTEQSINLLQEFIKPIFIEEVRAYLLQVN